MYNWKHILISLNDLFSQNNNFNIKIKVLNIIRY